MNVSVPRARLLPWWPLLALPLLVLLVYWPGIHGGFEFDDYPNIVDNLALRVDTLHWRAWTAAAFSSPASAVQRPLAMLTFAANQYFTGLDPMPMKVVNILIHALNALLVLALARRLLDIVARDATPARREWSARFIAATWALNPIQVMGVLYVVQRMESLCHVFVFAGLLAYMEARKRQMAGRSAWMLLLAALLGGSVLGVMAKESAVLLPLYAFFLECFVYRFAAPSLRDRNALKGLYFAGLFLPAIVGVAWLWGGVMPAYATRNFTLYERLLTEGRVVVDYLHWILLPSANALGLYHDDYVVSHGWLAPASTAFAFAVIAALVAMAWWFRTRRPLVALGIAWFLGAQVLTATIIPLELVYEHRNYFALLGVALVLADVLLVHPPAALERIGVVVAAIAVLFYAGVTLQRAYDWSSAWRFASIEAAKRPTSPRATYSLARTLVIETKFDPASPKLPETWKALDRALAVPGSGVLPHSAWFLLAAHVGRPDDPAVWRDLQAKLRANPIGAQEINALASMERCAREAICHFPPAQMRATFAAAMSHGPHPDIMTLEGDYAVNVLGDWRRATDLWRQVVAMRPDHPQYRINLAGALITIGDDAGAREQIDALRAMGHMGQNEAAADVLDKRLADRHAAPPRTGTIIDP